MYLGNAFDRSAEFKEIAKEMIQKYIDIIKIFAREQAIKYIQIFRRTDLTDEEKNNES